MIIIIFDGEEVLFCRRREKENDWKFFACLLAVDKLLTSISSSFEEEKTFSALAN
jgi:hypothetical protein